MQVEGEVIEEHISDKEAAYQRCISARSCKSLSGRVILASSLREVHSWWIFVRDLTLLMQ
jgi:hypothetical protein